MYEFVVQELCMAQTNLAFLYHERVIQTCVCSPSMFQQRPDTKLQKPLQRELRQREAGIGLCANSAFLSASAFLVFPKVRWRWICSCMLTGKKWPSPHPQLPIYLSPIHTQNRLCHRQKELVTDKARPSGSTRCHCQGKGREAYPCPAGPGSHLVWLLPLTEAIIVHLIHSCWAQVQQSSLNLQDVKAHFCEETDTRNTFSCRLLLHRKLQAVGSMLGALCSF